MPDVTLYYYPKCTTCRRARRFLGELGAQVTERRYFADLPAEDEIRKLASLLPGGVRDLVSTRSRRFREMDLEGRDLSDEEWTRLLAREPGLWRRPVAVRGHRAVVGFDPEAYRDLLR
ncbi:MAG: Spx/MgsR family RNA polymerase-binding regulatory protein [Firmicutes bacterium]|nr:Spx/MgsR family RNA polymerase-binding regulatory protein [Bacillota bacterium]